MAIDLHTHSTASDGALAPAALVAHAAQHGVTTLALTDHDTVAGLADAREAAAVHDIDFINGIELSVTWQRRTLHIVGLGFSADHPALTAGIAGLQAERERRAQQMGQRLARTGVADAYARARRLAGNGQITRSHFARLVVADGVACHTADAFKRILKPGRPGYASAMWATLDEAIGWIHAARGYAVLAHPFGYRFTGAWRRRALAAFAQAGGDAIEICTGVTSIEQEQRAAREASDYGLASSVGSDFHAVEQFWLTPGKLRPLPTGAPPRVLKPDQTR